MSGRLSWEQTRLALMQMAIQGFAAAPSLRGTTNLCGEALRWLPHVETGQDTLLNPIWEVLYNNRVAGDTQGTRISSVLGLAVALCSGTLIILLSFVMEMVVAFIQRHFKTGVARSDAWQRDDDGLQTIGFLFASHARATWKRIKRSHTHYGASR